LMLFRSSKVFKQTTQMAYDGGRRYRCTENSFEGTTSCSSLARFNAEVHVSTNMELWI
jgi:hypothetical protein